MAGLVAQWRPCHPAGEGSVAALWLLATRLQRLQRLRWLQPEPPEKTGASPPEGLELVLEMVLLLVLEMVLLLDNMDYHNDDFDPKPWHEVSQVRR